MIGYKSIHHVSIAVTDLEKARSFYTEILGLQEIERPVFDFPGIWYAIGQQQLHLIELKDSKTLRQSTEINTREGHFALRVNNYWETVEWLKKKGIKVIEKPKSRSGFAQVFCCDPDGNIIELNVDQSEV